MTTETEQNTTQRFPLSRAEFDALLRRLNLANTRRTYQAFARRAEQESWSYCDFLGRLLVEEVAKRKQTLDVSVKPCQNRTFRANCRELTCRQG